MWKKNNKDSKPWQDKDRNTPRSPAGEPRRKVYNQEHLAVRRDRQSGTQRMVHLDIRDPNIFQIEMSTERKELDTWLNNNTPIHISFREFLQGRDGSYGGPMDSVVLVEKRDGAHLSALCVDRYNRCHIYSKQPGSVQKLISQLGDGSEPEAVYGSISNVEECLAMDFFSSIGRQIKTELTFFRLDPSGLPHIHGGHQRFARPDESDKFHGIYGKYSGETGRAVNFDFKKLSYDHKLFLEVYEGNIASVLIKVHEIFDHVQIDGVYTILSYRRRGHASRLISAIAGQAANHGKSTVLAVPVENTPMHELLGKLNFREIDRVINVKFVDA